MRRRIRNITKPNISILRETDHVIVFDVGLLDNTLQIRLSKAKYSHLIAFIRNYHRYGYNDKYVWDFAVRIMSKSGLANKSGVYQCIDILTFMRTRFLR